MFLGMPLKNRLYTREQERLQRCYSLHDRGVDRGGQKRPPFLGEFLGTDDFSASALTLRERTWAHNEVEIGQCLQGFRA